jgi:hypothetical protein
MKSEDIQKEQVSLGAEIEALEDAAGIRAEADRAREGPFMPLHIGDMAPFGSEERMQQIAEEEEHDHGHYRRKIRKVYLNVKDPEIRKQLIQKERKAEKLQAQSFEADVYKARSELNKIKETAGRNWHYTAAGTAALMVAGGYGLFNVPGAIGGAIVGYFLGRGIEENTRKDRERLIANAENNLQDLERTWRSIKSRPEIFSFEEEMGDDIMQKNSA